MDCPKCPGILQEIILGGYRKIKRCPACGGLWFDKDELWNVVNRSIFGMVDVSVEIEQIKDEKLLGEVDLNSIEIACPRCKGSEKMIKMPSLRNKEVIMDYCPKCGGIWLDSGEFSRISRPVIFEAGLGRIVRFFRLCLKRLNIRGRKPRGK